MSTSIKRVEDLEKRIMGMIPQAAIDHDGWRRYFAGILDESTQSCELDLLRHSKKAEQFEMMLSGFIVNCFPEHSAVLMTPNTRYQIAIELARLEPQARAKLLAEVARRLRA